MRRGRRAGAAPSPSHQPEPAHAADEPSCPSSPACPAAHPPAHQVRQRVQQRLADAVVAAEAWRWAAGGRRQQGARVGQQRWGRRQARRRRPRSGQAATLLSERAGSACCAAVSQRRQGAGGRAVTHPAALRTQPRPPLRSSVRRRRLISWPRLMFTPAGTSGGGRRSSGRPVCRTSAVAGWRRGASKLASRPPFTRPPDGTAHPGCTPG